MHYTLIPATDVRVSALCLGTMTFGEQNTESEAHAQLDYALERGINFIDTAEMYPVPPRANTQGLTETYIGTWLKSRACREQVVIATKVSGPGSTMRYLRGGPQLTREHIQQALQQSLKRLQTDYVDLYQVHWPARDANFFGQLSYQHNPDERSTPIVTTLRALAKFVEQGKIRWVGISNETPWGEMQYLHLAEQHSLPKIVSIQNPYNLLNRTYEVGVAEISHREGVGLLAYSPLAFGVLSGKYINGARPEGSRLTLFPRFDRYNNRQAQQCVKRYVKLARDFDLEPAQMALAFVNSRPFLLSNIIVATNLDQLKQDIDSVEIQLPDEVIQAIEGIHQAQPNPSP